jgi:hypothetical protein
MNTSKGKISIVVMLSFVLLLSACGGGQAMADETLPEPAVEPTSEPTLEPTSTPEIEPEVVDLGYDTQLLLRGLPEYISVDAAIGLELKGNLPPSNRKYDYVKSEIAVIKVTKNGTPYELDAGVVEICFTVSYSGSGEPPDSFFWDTSKDPMVGSSLKKSRVVEEPNYTVCTAVRKSGAYAIIMH